MHFFNYLEVAVPVPLRRSIAKWLPHENFQNLRRIVDTMHDRSVQIFREKRAALLGGDGSLKQHLGEGKDIMSILCTHRTFDSSCETHRADVSTFPQ